jgi:hypothetical protein
LEHKPEVRKTGRTTYQLDGREVDFSAHIGMPPLPNAFTKLQGAVISGLANITALIRIFEIMGRYSLRKMLKHNPV